MRSLLTLILLSVWGINCQAQNADDGNTPAACTFTNPVSRGADPWVIYKDGMYFAVRSGDRGVYVSKAEEMTDVLTSKAEEVKVWGQPASGWNKENLWAPELHFVQGNWYIYYTAGEAGPPFIHQKSGVLKAKTDDPLGEYEDMGLLYTGDHIETGEDNTWSIDLTVLELNNTLYAIWSGWEQNTDTDKTPQHLFIAEMENPYTMGSNRVKISSPVETWERGTELPINEGPEILQHNGETFIVYSASESWLPAYNLGHLRLKAGADPMKATSWEKKGSVFHGAGRVYGTGHASFTTSPDGTENWIVFHTKVDENPGWNRVVYMQPFGWNADGSPDFGTPVQPGESIAKPSGACME